jgi:ABC-type branched-subunit amino acid transport system permease subunit
MIFIFDFLGFIMETLMLVFFGLLSAVVVIVGVPNLRLADVCFFIVFLAVQSWHLPFQKQILRHP